MTRAGAAQTRSNAARADQRIHRALIARIEEGLKRDGCALLLGPYEVGKSDVAHEIVKRFGGGAYFLNANQERDRTKLAGETGLVRDSAGKLIVIDEIHGYPDGLDLIRAELESARRDHRPIGQFLILGSRTLEVERLASNKLGTRTTPYRLGPIALVELPGERPWHGADTRTLGPEELVSTVAIAYSNAAIPMQMLWMRGGFPLSLLAQNDADSFDWRKRYIESLCARGYGHISPSLSASTVKEILMRVAVTQGEPFTVDRSRLEQKACLDHLEDLGLIRRLVPWFPNELKRLEKSPKVYIRDSGLLHCLLNRRTHDELRGDARVLGHSWEGFCIENLLEAAAPHANAFYFRSEDQDEIDLVLEFSGGRRLAIEIKSESAKLGDGFKTALNVIKPIKAYVVRPVPESYDNSNHRVMTLRDMIDVVRTELH